MNDIKLKWKSRVLEELKALAAEANLESGDFEKRLSVGKPPKSEMGDFSFPLFPFAKDFRKAPAALASDLAVRLSSGGRVSSEGPYLNVRIDRSAAIGGILSAIAEAGPQWGSGSELSGNKVMIEFSSPNTNKPLHLGHLRNDILGESCARIMKARGADVQKVNLVNDRGVHICKSMLAYKKFGNGETPESLGIISDRFVGDLYVRFSQWANENPEAEAQAQKMLQDWESGDVETRKLWKTMNLWALNGIEATYQRTGVSFDRIYRESETYLLGKEQVLKGLESGVFFRHEDGSIRLDMSEIGLDTKVLLRPSAATSSGHSISSFMLSVTSRNIISKFCFSP